MSSGQDDELSAVLRLLLFARKKLDALPYEINTNSLDALIREVLDEMVCEQLAAGRKADAREIEREHEDQIGAAIGRA